MNRLLMQIVLSAILVAAGYALYPLTHDPHGGNDTASVDSSLKSQAQSYVVAACELNLEQIDHLASRIAPMVVERLATSGLNGVSPDPKVAAQQRESREKEKANQDATFNRATQMIDQMIANRQVTQQGIIDAAQLLQQTGQADRAYLLQARIAAAVNRGELTPEQAGLLRPR